MSAKGNRVAQVVMPVHQLPEQKTLLVTPHQLPTPQAESRSAPPPTAQTARHARFAVFGFVSRPAYPGVCPEAPGDLRLPAARETPGTPALSTFRSASSNPATRTPLRASSIRLRPPQLSTNSWIKLSSDELNRLPLKFAPLVPISLLATTTVANAGDECPAKSDTAFRVHNQSKFRYPLTNLTTSDRWTVRSLRKWAILAVPKDAITQLIFGGGKEVPKDNASAGLSSSRQSQVWKAIIHFLILFYVRFAGALKPFRYIVISPEIPNF